jgi:hypothetical protein
MKTHETITSDEYTPSPTLRLRPRAVESVSLEIPVEALAALRKVAARRDMSSQGLLKSYIGQGLRQDLARLFSDRVLASTAEVLVRHLPSEEIPAILKEIQAEVTVEV